MPGQIAQTTRPPRRGGSHTGIQGILLSLLCFAGACLPGLPGSDSSGGTALALLATVNAASTTDPANVNQGTACSLNAGSGVIGSSEASFAIVSTPNAAQPDRAVAVVADYDSIYVGGWESIAAANRAWRIEKRDRITGNLVTAFGTGGVVTVNPSADNEQLSDMVIDASGLYLVGTDRTLGGGNSRWRIEKRDLTTGALVGAFGTAGVFTTNLSGQDDVPFGAAIDANALYVVGSYGTGGGNKAWRLETRDLTTGALLMGVNSAAGTGTQAQARAVAVDANFMYVAGARVGVNVQWRIEKRDRTTLALVPAFNGTGQIDENPSAGLDEALGIAVDGNAVYTAGSNSNGSGRWRVTKRDLTTGALDVGFNGTGIVNVNPSAGLDRARSVVIDGEDLLLGGTDRIPGNQQARISKYNRSDGTLLAAFDGDGTLQLDPTTGGDEIEDFCVDSGYIYAVGNTEDSFNEDWYIVKRNKTTGL